MIVRTSLAFACILGGASCSRADLGTLEPATSDVSLEVAQGATESQVIAFSSSSNTVTLTGVTSASWLTAEATESEGRAALLITADAAALDQGAYETTLLVSGRGYKTLPMPITVTVGLPELRFDPPTASLSARENAEVDEVVSVSSTLPGAAIELQSDADWLTLTPPENGIGAFTLHGVASDLAIASYASTVRANAPGFRGAVLPVSMNVLDDCMKTLEVNIQPNSRLDVGWSGTALDTVVPEGRLTLRLNCESGASCSDQCTIEGLLDNSVLNGKPSNRRCTGDSFTQCETDANCTSAGGSCRFYLPRISLIAGGMGDACLSVAFRGALAGTTDIVLGTGSLESFDVDVNVRRGQVCPQCVASACVGGARPGATCVIDAASLWGETSLDCPAVTGSESNATIHFPPMTLNENATWTLSTQNPPCTGDPFTSSPCFCSTCNNAAGNACTLDGDCPLSGSCAAGVNAGAPCTANGECPGSECQGKPCSVDANCAGGGLCLAGFCSTLAGKCGAKRCIGGAYEGAPCSANASCGAGLCNWVGEPILPNRCSGDSVTCETTATIARCTDGPIRFSCSVSAMVPCDVDADCPTGESCSVRRESCWSDNGALGATVSTELTFSSSAQEPSLGALFCIGAVGVGEDSAAGLPGPGRLRLYTDVAVHD